VGQPLARLFNSAFDYDQQALPQNFGFGHGWIEGGPLLPSKANSTRQGSVQKRYGRWRISPKLAGKTDISAQLDQEFSTHKALLNQVFWSAEKNYFAYAVDANSQRLDIPVCSLPFLCGSALQTTTSHRKQSISSRAVIISPIGACASFLRRTQITTRRISLRIGVASIYRVASVGEYKYHRVQPAYANLRANALLALEWFAGACHRSALR